MEQGKPSGFYRRAGGASARPNFHRSVAVGGRGRSSLLANDLPSQAARIAYLNCRCAACSAALIGVARVEPMPADRRCAGPLALVRLRAVLMSARWEMVASNLTDLHKQSQRCPAVAISVRAPEFAVFGQTKGPCRAPTIPPSKRPAFRKRMTLRRTMYPDLIRHLILISKKGHVRWRFAKTRGN
jgi:hypothetical protein